MNKKLYADGGYLDFDYILKNSEKHNCPFIFIVGGRGTGKTYGALKYTLEHDIEIMFMRRTQSQHDIIRKDEFSPYNALNRDLDLNIKFFPISKYNSAIYNSSTDENGKAIPKGDMLGMTCALSTISNLRGFSSSADIVIYDEFIPERHEKPIKSEASALFNALETIGRNRELQGKKPLKLLALANANNISNDIFVSLGLVGVAERMSKTGQELHYDHAKGIMLLILSESPISDMKSYTKLYQMTQNTEFAEMSINNGFIGVAHDVIESQDLREYKLVCIVGELAIYKHKSQLKYYVTTHISGNCSAVYTTSLNSLRTFRLKHRDLWVRYCLGSMRFESYTLQVLFEKYNRTC